MSASVIFKLRNALGMKEKPIKISEIYQILGEVDQELRDYIGCDVIDTQKTLPFGTPDEVYEQVQERLRILGADGGYVFGGIHNIVAKTPVENIISMLKAVKDFNR